MSSFKRRSFLGLFATGFVAFFISPAPTVRAIASPQIRNGDACKKLGRRKRDGAKTFECVDLDGVRQWKRVKTVAEAKSEIKVLNSSELALGASQTVVANARGRNYAVVVTRTAGGVVAFSRICTHQGSYVAPTGNNQLTCPSHGAVFNASTGAVIEGPANQALPSYEASEREGSIYIKL